MHYLIFLNFEVGGVVPVVIGEELETQINGTTLSRVLLVLSGRKDV